MPNDDIKGKKRRRRSWVTKFKMAAWLLLLGQRLSLLLGNLRQVLLTAAADNKVLLEGRPWRRAGRKCVSLGRRL